MSENNNDLSPPELSLQHDKNIAHRALGRVVGFAAVTLAGVALFAAHEARIGWNFNPDRLDGAQTVDAALTGFSFGISIGSYGLYADARNRIRYRQEMIDRKNDN
jgi:hypothetical protein